VRDYELTFVVRPDIDDTQTKAAAARIESLITQRGGQLTNVQNWGKRRLAYHIGHHGEGSYFVYRLQMEPAFAAEIEHELNLDEQVLRFIAVYLDPVELEALKSPPAPMAAREPRPPRREAEPAAEVAPAAGAEAASPAAAATPAAGAEAEAPAAGAEAAAPAEAVPAAADEKEAAAEAEPTAEAEAAPAGEPAEEPATAAPAELEGVAIAAEEEAPQPAEAAAPAPRRPRARAAAEPGGVESEATSAEPAETEEGKGHKPAGE